MSHRIRIGGVESGPTERAGSGGPRRARRSRGGRAALRGDAEPEDDAPVLPPLVLTDGAQLGIGSVALALAASADATANPNLRALVRELAVRVALADNDPDAAEDQVEAALAIVDEHAVPTVAWRLHASAHDVFRS